MSIKYQIFISSTYEDLKLEREQVIKATLEMGHIPVGMEMFSAADEEQWKIITRQIDQADYYVVIIAHRYGSVVDGISYTEKEYDYAVEKGIPILGFIIDENASWPADKIDKDTIVNKSLENFKFKARKKPVGFWSSAEDLYGKFSIALMKEITINPRPGWIQASDIAGPEVIVELSRLSSENAKLRKALKDALQRQETEILEKRKKLIATLLNNKISISIWYESASTWDDKGINSSLYILFTLLAPELTVEQSIEDAVFHIGFMLKPEGKKIRKSFPIPSNSLKVWFSDLLILGLIKPSERKHSLRDKKEYWTLTDEGREIYALIRKQELEQTIVKRDDPAPEKEKLPKKKPKKVNTSRKND